MTEPLTHTAGDTLAWRRDDMARLRALGKRHGVQLITTRRHGATVQMD